MASSIREEALRRLLGGAAAVECLRGEEELLPRLRRHAPDLILFAPPVGPTPCAASLRRLRLEPSASGVPLVVLAAQRDESSSVQWLTCGAADVAYDEMGPREVRARLERCIAAATRERVLLELAQTDALTGLANFGALRTRLELEFKRAHRYEYPLTLAMLDLDRLKGINDTHGHDVGNRALVAVAEHLRTNLRETDFAARFGGDEFVLLLPYQTPAEGAVLLERLRTGLSRVRVPLDGGGALFLTASAGVAGHVRGSPKSDARELLACADAALCEAKRAGRDRHVVFEASHTEAREVAAGE